MDLRSEIWVQQASHVQLGSEDARQIRQRLRGCPSCECPAQQIVEFEKKNRQIVESDEKKVVEATAEEKKKAKEKRKSNANARPEVHKTWGRKSRKALQGRLGQFGKRRKASKSEQEVKYKHHFLPLGQAKNAMSIGLWQCGGKVAAKWCLECDCWPKICEM